MSIGPVDVIIVHFPQNRFTGQIAPALRNLVAGGVIRIIDLQFVSKESDGTVRAAEIAGLGEDLQPAFAEFKASDSGVFLDDEAVTSAAANLAPNSSAAVLVWENLWAVPFAEAVGAAGGVLVQQTRIPREEVLAALDS